VTARVVESALIAVGIVSLLAVVTLRKDLAGGAGTDNASLILNYRSLVALHNWTFLLGPAFCAAIGNGLMLERAPRRRSRRLRVRTTRNGHPCPNVIGIGGAVPGELVVEASRRFHHRVLPTP
jgi:hypothetical protein